MIIHASPPASPIPSEDDADILHASPPASPIPSEDDANILAVLNIELSPNSDAPSSPPLSPSLSLLSPGLPLQDITYIALEIDNVPEPVLEFPEDIATVTAPRPTPKTPEQLADEERQRLAEEERLRLEEQQQARLLHQIHRRLPR